MTEQELKIMSHWLDRLQTDLDALRERLHAYACVAARPQAAAAGHVEQEKKESKEETEKEKVPHTPYKEKGKEETKERKELSLAHSSENSAHPVDERERVRRFDVQVLFDRFWRVYPRKVAKIAARKAFERILRKADDPAALTATMCRALERQRDSENWTHDEGRFVPYPATWLNAGRWEDEPETGDPGDAPADAASLAWLYGKPQDDNGNGGTEHGNN